MESGWSPSQSRSSRIAWSNSFGVGVVDPQDELAAVFSREKEIVQRGSDIADMEAARRRRREARNDVHRGNFALGPVWKKLLIG
jgi:hypothetical protein